MEALRSAREFRVPPSRCLGLPAPQWGELDTVLMRVLADLDAGTCPCCGQWAAEAHDPNNEGRYVVEGSTCYAGAALREWRKSAGEDAVPSVRLAAPGEQIGYDEAKAQEIQRELQERLSAMVAK